MLSILLRHAFWHTHEVGSEEQVVGDVVCPEVVEDFVGSEALTEQIFHEKMHRCENIVDHPPSVAIDKPTTPTTNTTTILTTNDKHYTIGDKYVVVSHFREL